MANRKCFGIGTKGGLKIWLSTAEKYFEAPTIVFAVAWQTDVGVLVELNI